MFRKFAAALSVLLVLAGCTVATPGEPLRPASQRIAEVRLAKALDRLGAERALHYRGSFAVGGDEWGGLDLRVTASGVANGTMSRDGHVVNVLWIDPETVLIRADERFWATHLRDASPGTDVDNQAMDHAKRWVQVKPDVASQAGDELRPPAVARQFRQMVTDTGVQEVSSGVVDGQPVSVLTVGDTRFHVSQSAPHQVVKIDERPEGGSEPREGDRFRGPTGVTGLQPDEDPDPDPESDEDAESEPESESGSDEDGLLPGPMDATAVDDLYDAVDQQVNSEAFRNAADSRVQFSTQSDLGVQCPQLGGGVCTIRGTVSNSVSTTAGQVSGSVQARMQASAVGPVNSGSCSATASMPPNGSAAMSCGVALSVPTCNKPSGMCQWPVTVRAYFTAQAQLNVTRIVEELGQKRGTDTAPRRPDEPEPRAPTRRADCPTGNSFVPGTAVLMADGTYQAIEDVRIGDLVAATDPETRESGDRRVTNTITGRGHRTLVAISIDVDGDDGHRTATIHATDGHPFWVNDRRRWADAVDLDAGDDLATSNGDQFEVLSTTVTRQLATVHNLTVAGLHTYYVRAGTGNVLVHNSSAPQNCGPPVSRQKQDQHVVGTPEYNERIRQGTPTSYFNSRSEAHAYAQHAWQNGTPVPGRPGMRDFEYGLPVGRGPNGGWQTMVRAHIDGSGNVHAHPKGPEY